jgi:hypothetical protein
VPLAATMISHLYGADSMKLRLQVRNIFLVWTTQASSLAWLLNL